MNENEIKRKNIKDSILNILGFFVIFAFLAIGIILFLGATKKLGKINLAGIIACYIFGSLFLLIFLLIIIKIILILKSQNKYAKQAIDVNKLFEDMPLNDEEKKVNALFLDAFSSEINNLNILFGAFYEIEKKRYKKEIDLTSSKIRMLMQKMIMEGIEEFGFFDLYLVIDFAKTINKKFIWKSDFKKYKTYFTYIRNIHQTADDYIYDKYINVQQ
ncbi:Hypothetical protein, predicted transmembrane protein [Metamycoplasma auris 15026]|uniref:Uncharacterized protein n=1 Tax=Metamycoplasma auris 15026 TaxID=1188233 RepID=N9TR57_9BACT|nr:hypothetical protein [Metamycoplasma auris]ENY68560.1 Hypothetical protein, predicted transmembrane protein [Metamycoplasma auris 15026]